MTDQIDRLLFETQLTDDPELRSLLAELHRAATSVHPMPSAEVSALMAPGRRRSSMRARGGAITALIVVGTLGVGVTAAAAVPQIQNAAQQVYQAVTGANPPGTDGSSRHGTPGAPSAPAGHSNSNAASPHPDATDHPGPSDHPGDGSTNAAAPHPGGSHGPASGHPTPTPAPSASPGQDHKP